MSFTPSQQVAISQVAISVVIPTYNRGAAIRQTLDSALQQDLPPDEVEILVIDDGSTDGTFAFLQENYGNHPRVRLFSIANGGVARARNFGLEKACGEFIAFLDHDDVWLPEKLRVQRDVLHARPEAGVVYCLWREVDENGCDVDKTALLKRARSGKMPDGKVFPQILYGNFVISMTLPLIRTSLLKKIDGFDPKTVPSDDWDLWIRLARITHFAYLPKPLVHYVFHSNQQHSDLEVAFKSSLAIIAKHPVKFRDYPHLWGNQKMFKRFSKEEIAYQVAKKTLVDGNFFKIVSLFIQALLQRPDKAIHKRWAYLFLRALKGNTQPY